MDKKRVLITGASGLVGSAVSITLTDTGYEVWKLVRRVTGEGNEIQWNALAEEKSIDTARLENFDAVIHLAGEPVFGRWTPDKKRRIHDSRVQGTRTLCASLAQCKQPPKVLVCASAIGYYGNRGDEILTENSGPGSGFLAEVVREWEAAAEPARTLGIRTVNLRIGIVLSRSGGALEKMLPAFRLGLGGPIGNGNHWMSWITLHDLVRLIVYSMGNESVAGILNAVAPVQVTNSQFTKTLADVLHRPAFLPVPVPVLRIIFGQFADEAMVVSERVVPEKLLEMGFQFENGNLKDALQSVLPK